MVTRKGYGELVDKLDDREVFVFGSNRQGLHIGGAAAFAMWGGNKPTDTETPSIGTKGVYAVFGLGLGLHAGISGLSYAIPTVDYSGKPGAVRVSVVDICKEIGRMYECARQYLQHRFLVAGSFKTGNPISGYSHDEFCAMYAAAGNIPDNVIFSDSYTAKIFGGRALRSITFVDDKFIVNHEGAAYPFFDITFAVGVANALYREFGSTATDQAVPPADHAAPTIAERVAAEGVKFFTECTGLNVDGCTAFLSGSAAFGDKTQMPGDVDICTHVCNIQRISQSLSNANVPYTVSNYYNAIHVHSDSVLINVLFLSDDEFKIWKLATDMCCMLPPLHDKQHRHALFELLRGCCKMAFAESNTQGYLAT